MNTVIYARYSSAGQTEQSIEGQLRVCKEYAERNGYFVIGEYIDRATTGTNDNRPQFQQMLEDAKKGEFKFILVYKLDRFARNKYDSTVHKHNLAKMGIKVISATESISDSPEGKLLEGLLEMVAEMFSADFSQKVKRGMKESRLKGHFVGGKLLYGYKIIDKKPVIDEDKAEAVRYAFSEYAKGKSKKQIVAELNAKGFRTNQGKPFTFNSFEYCLSNRKYIGVDNADGVENVTRYPRIIEDELFFKVQERLETTRKRPATKKADIEYLLSGKCFCDLCDSTMFGISGTSKTKGQKHRYYACSCQYKLKHCSKKYEKKFDLEQEVAVATLLYVLAKGYYEEIASRLEKEYANENDERAIKELERQIRKINTEIDKLFDLFYKAENDEFRKRMNAKAAELEQNKKTLITELARLKNSQTKRMNREEMILMFIGILSKRKIGDEEFMKFLIKEFVKSVYVSEKEITIYYNIGNDNEPHKIPKNKRNQHKKKAEPLSSANSPDTNNPANGVRISDTLVHQTKENTDTDKNRSPYFLFGISVREKHRFIRAEAYEISQRFHGFALDKARAPLYNI